MSRKVIIDCDMGIDDAVALCMALFDSRLDVLAITATEGCVTAEQANNNLHAVLAELDPERYPRLGMAESAEDAPAVDTRYLYGEDGLGNSGFEVARLQHGHRAEKIIIDSVRANPHEVTLICLGPLTNISRAFQRDPGVPELLDQIVMTGGTLNGIGNITPAAEFNFYFDPSSARNVLNTRTTKTLIPLDVSRQVNFGFDLIEELPRSGSRAGDFLRQILPFAFRAYRQQLGMETIVLNDVVGTLAVLEPQLFTFEMMAGDIETEGELTRGASVFDRRVQREWRNNMQVATEINSTAAKQYIIDQLVLSGRHT